MTRQESDVVVIVRRGAACFLKGAACFLKYPKGFQVEIRDYDVEDYDEKDLHGDEQGNKYFPVVIKYHLTNLEIAVR